MADFKKLSELDVQETVSDVTNVVIEDNGNIRRLPVSEVGFKLNELTEASVLDSISDTANVVIEDNGNIRRLPSTMLKPKGLVFEITEADFDTSDTYEFSEGPVITKNYDELYEAFSNGNTSVIKFTMGDMTGYLTPVSFLPWPEINAAVGMYCGTWEFPFLFINGSYHNTEATE